MINSMEAGFFNLQQNLELLNMVNLEYINYLENIKMLLLLWNISKTTKVSLYVCDIFTHKPLKQYQWI